MTNTTTDRKSPLLIINPMSSSRGAGVWLTVEWRNAGMYERAWSHTPSLAQSCMLLVTVGETLAVSL